MKYFIPVASLAFLVVAPVLAQDAKMAPLPPRNPAVHADRVSRDVTRLDISSQAVIKADPDMATITAGVVTDGATADSALKENGAKMNAVFAALKKAGIKDADIQTSGLNVNPQYKYEENKAPKIIGYQAMNNVTVVLRNLKEVGTVLDTLVSEGANQINGPAFAIEDPEELMDRARAEAVKKARKRAEIYANATGLKIKRISTISEQVGYNHPPMPYFRGREMAQAASAPADAASPVASGQVDVSVTANIGFELE